MTNEEYIKRYPWLAMRDPYPEEGESDVYCAMEDMPRGWEIAFGPMFCEEMDQAIKKAEFGNKFEIIQLKEKFGQMRAYCHPSNSEIENIIYKYSTISAHVCILCGEVDVHMLHLGWISPYCRRCFGKINRNGHYRPYDELAGKEARIPDKMYWTRFTKDGKEDCEMDIKETADRVRENCKARHANKMSRCNSKQEDNEDGT